MLGGLPTNGDQVDEDLQGLGAQPLLAWLPRRWQVDDAGWAEHTRPRPARSGRFRLGGLAGGVVVEVDVVFDVGAAVGFVVGFAVGVVDARLGPCVVDRRVPRGQ